MRQIESLFLGVIAALGALVLELVALFIISSFIGYESALPEANLALENLFSPDAVSGNLYLFYFFLFVSVIIEESLKYSMIAKRVDKISLDRGLILNSLLMGLGFAFVEVALIYMKMGGTIEKTFYHNMVEITLIHISTAGIIGYFIAMGNPAKIRTFIKAVLLASFLHLLYNLLAVYRDSYPTEPFIVGLLTILAVLNIFNVIEIEERLAS